MTLADLLLGRREPKRARLELINGIVAARRSFEVELDVRAAAVAIEPQGMSGRGPSPSGLDALLGSIAEDTGAMVERRQDGFGLQWVTFWGGSLDDLALSVGVLAESLHLAGHWDRVVCAAFVFQKASNPAAWVYWIYNFQRGTFYPFVPQRDARRDSEEEARLRAAVEHDLRLERDPQQWYPLWGIPV
jgi:hypothetical protein